MKFVTASLKVLREFLLRDLRVLLVVCALPTTCTMANIAGFNSGEGWTRNALPEGSSKPAFLTGNSLQITDGVPAQGRSVFFSRRQKITRFHSEFTYRNLTPANGVSPGEGFAFVIQNEGAGAVGPGGRYLGYGKAGSTPENKGISTSAGIVFNIRSGSGVNYAHYDGSVFAGADYISTLPVRLDSNQISVILDYDGATLNVHLLDQSNGLPLVFRFAVNLSGEVGSPYAFVGFTGGSSEAVADQRISNFVFVEIPDSPPVIKIEPKGASPFVGGSVTLEVQADGTPPLNYQWRLNGSPLHGQTGPTLALTNLTVAQRGNYDVLVSNAAAAVSSAVAEVRVLARFRGLYSTGQNESGMPLADGQIDAHYRLVLNPDSSGNETIVHALTVYPIWISPGVPGPWFPPLSQSQWISPRFNSAGAAPGLYAYRTTFDLTGLDPAKAFLQINCGGGPVITDILLNEVVTGIRGIGPQLGGFALFNQTSARFQPGLNTLEFRILNDTAGQTGLRVFLSGGAELEPNNPPVANADTFQVTSGNTLSITSGQLLANDTDVDGDPLTLSSISSASTQGGVVSRFQDSILYSPRAGFTGEDSFTYELSDGKGGTATGDIRVTVLTIKPPGSVIAWGGNPSTQTTVPEAAQSGVSGIAAGNGFSVALKTNRSVLAWGVNDRGQTDVPGGAQGGVIALAAGDAHALALKTDGSVVAWGVNDHGQTTVPTAAQSGVIAIAAGFSHNLILKTDGSVFAWGDQTWGQTTVPSAAQSGVIAISAGAFHSVSLKTDGSVVAWGYSGSGQASVPALARSGVIAIAAGGYHSMALKTDGSVVAWGDNGFGQTTVPAAAQSGVIAIAAGDAHSLALKSDGSVVAWGWNRDGQIDVPAVAKGRAIAISAGYSHSLALVPPRPPTITSAPQGKTVVEGSPVSFAVGVEGTPPFTYQWRFAASPDLNASAATIEPNTKLSISLHGIPGARTYHATLSGGWFGTFAISGDSIGRGDYIYTPPSAKPATLTLLYAGSRQNEREVIYLWFLDGYAVNASGERIATGSYDQKAYDGGSIGETTGGTPGTALTPVALPGQTGSTLSYAGVTMDQAGDYDVVVSNAVGLATSPPAKLIVRPANHPPQAGEATFITATGQTLTLTSAALLANLVDPDGDALSITAVRATSLLGGAVTLAQGKIQYVPPAGLADNDVFWFIVSDAKGGFTSVEATVRIGQAPEILTQPTSLRRTEGETAQLSVEAKGTLPLSYQWQFNQVDLPGQTQSTLQLIGLKPGQSGDYTVRVSNSFGHVSSRKAVVIVDNGTLPTGQTLWFRADRGVNADAVGKVSSWVSGAGEEFELAQSDPLRKPFLVADPLSGQSALRFDGTGTFLSANAVAGRFADSNSVSIFLVQKKAVGNDQGLVLGWTAVDGLKNRMLIHSPFAGTNYFDFGSLAEGRLAAAGQPATPGQIQIVELTRFQTGLQRMAINGVPQGQASLDSSLDISIPGTFSVGGLMELYYGGEIFEMQVFRAPLSPSDSDLVRQSLAQRYGVALPPTIKTQPVGKSVAEGESVAFTLETGGSGPLSYQWRFGGVELPGQTTATLTLSSVAKFQAGNYDAVVSNAAGSVTSSPALLVVRIRPTENAPPVAVSDVFRAVSGQTLTISTADLLANDIDVNGDTLAITSVRAIGFFANGSAQVHANYITYLATVPFDGGGILEYTVSDGRGGTDEGFVSIELDQRDSPDWLPLDTAPSWQRLESLPSEVVAKPLLSHPNYLGNYGISVIGSGLPGVAPVYQAGGTADVTVFVRNSYSDRSQDPDLAGYGDIYLESPPQGYLRKVASASPCPLPGEPFYWILVGDYSNPMVSYTKAEAFEHYSESTIPIAFGGSSIPPSPRKEIFRFRFNAVPPGEYVFYAAHAGYTYFPGGQWFENAAQARISVKRVVPLVSDIAAKILSPSSGLKARVGQSVSIHYTLSDNPQVQSWLNYSVSVDGETLRHKVFDWRSQTLQVDETIQWTPATPGRKTITVRGQDTECQSAFDSVEIDVEGECERTPAGLLSWFRGEGNAIDASGGFSGIPHGTVTYVAGKVGQAFGLNGTDAFIEIPNSSRLNPSSQMSVEAWYRPAPFRGNGNNAIIDKSLAVLNSSPIQYRLGVVGNLNPSDAGSFFFSVGSVKCSTVKNFWSPGNWYHLVGTYDGTTAKLYANGALIDAHETHEMLRDLGGNLVIGGYSSRSAQTLTPGDVDEVSLYGHALGVAEVQAIYAAGGAGKCEPSAFMPVLSASRTSGGLAFMASAAPGQSYQLQHKPSLFSSTWAPIGSPISSQGPMALFDVVIASGSEGFFRVVTSPAATPTAWRSADLIFPAGTQVIKIHFSDEYTYRTNRQVRIGVRGAELGWGWGTWVYPESSAKFGEGYQNPTFFLSSGGGIGVTPGSSLTALEPGKVYGAIVECEQAKFPNTFNFEGFEGVMVIEEPVELVKGSRRFYIKIPVRQTLRFTFAVEPGR